MLPRLVGVILLITPAFAHAAAPPRPLDSAQVQNLLKRLDADNFHIRQRADQSLRDLGKSVLPYLREEMNRTRSLEVRWRLGRIVHDLTLDERIHSLVQLLADRDLKTRERADWTLRQAGSAVVPLLEQQLKPELSLEQRKRIRQIIAELSSENR